MNQAAFLANVTHAACTIVEVVCVDVHATPALQTTALAIIQRVLDERAVLLCDNSLVAIALCCVAAAAALVNPTSETRSALSDVGPDTADSRTISFAALIRVAVTQLDEDEDRLRRKMVQCHEGERDETDIVSFYNCTFVPAVLPNVVALTRTDGRGEEGKATMTSAVLLQRRKRTFTASALDTHTATRIRTLHETMGKRHRYEFGTGAFSVKRMDRVGHYDETK